MFILSLSSASVFALLTTTSRENGAVDNLRFRYVPKEISFVLVKVLQTMVGVILIGAMLASIKAISLWRMRYAEGVMVLSPSRGTKEQMNLTNRQLGLIGMKPRVEPAVVESSKKPPRSTTKPASPSEILVPLHQQITTTRSSRIGSDKSSTSGGSKMHPFSTSSKSPTSPSLYLVPAASSQSPSVQNSASSDEFGATPWSNKRAAFHKEITTEEELEKFLVDVDDRISESASKLATPPPTIKGFGTTSANTVPSSASTSGTTRSTPLRPVRMSPGSQKFTTPPKKGEVDLPPPMSMEESLEAFQHLGIYPEIELWRDCLRQWFSSVLLNPLLIKIGTSHVKVMQSAAKLGITISISQVGNDTPSTVTTATVSPIGGTTEWQLAFAIDEDGLLQQLQTTLIQALDASLYLAEGTCVKNYEYLGSGEVYDKVNKKWTFELPTDSHLLLYLFCAFLEHPKWMLHVDPSHAAVQSSKNPLLLGVLPPKERFPEKYIAVILGVPSVLHPGACVLAIGKQSPPIFALYWDKKPHFSVQGRTALWDSILLLCHKIKTGYGGVVRGMHLGSSALSILPVLDPETED